MKIKSGSVKPAADKRALLFLAGLVWVGVGTMLLFLSYSWLIPPRVNGNSFVFAGAGIALALVVHHFGFLKIADKNLRRILPMEGKQCIFSFMTWKSYVIAALMAAMGALLRHSQIPKPYLSILYTGIGLALILSSVRYMRVLLSQLKK